MPNYFVTYDLNGPKPSHKEMDERIQQVAVLYGRVLETVWYVKYHGSATQLRDHLALILGKEDLLLVIDAQDAAWTGLLIDSDSLLDAWKSAA